MKTVQCCFAMLLFFSGVALAATPIETLSSGQGVSVSDILYNGGAVVIVLALMSVITIALAFRAYNAVKISTVRPMDLHADLTATLGQGNLKQARVLSLEPTSVLARIADAGLSRLSSTPERVHDAIQSTGRREMDKTARLVEPLSHIGSIAPMLGLLGTGIGMIRFLSAQGLEAGLGRTQLLSLSMSQALITTIIGIGVGVLAKVLFFSLRYKLLQTTAELEETSEHLYDLIVSASEE